ncbi:MAG: PD-(D/E)XK nuclease family protein [Gammaproteobacteria bacterium]|nr:PD-(D/E)XK nuclease family protein [Gammaproteobacteria bacterium]
MASFSDADLTLLSAIDAGCLVLTPNHRTSTQLLDLYGQHVRSQQNKTICPTPNIFPVDIWIRQQFDMLVQSGNDAFPALTLLESSQEKMLWQQVISQSDSGGHLLNQSATARAVQEAWSLLHLWCIDRKELQSFSSPRSSRIDKTVDDVDAFLEWSDSFTAFCEKKSLITLVQVLERLITVVKAKGLSLPDNLILAGFQQSPPLYQSLFDELEEIIKESTPYSPPACTPTITKAGLQDASTELVAAAQWAKQVIEDQPDARIGIIVPDLYGRHRQTQRLFSRVYSAAETQSLQPSSSWPYYVSVSGPASSHPLLHAALKFLALNSYNTPTLKFCSIIRSPYLVGADEEETSRGNLERFLRRKNIPQLSNADLRYYSNQESWDTWSPILADALMAFDQLIKPGAGRQQDLAAWGKLFEEQLVALGWPGARSLNKSDIRALESWSELLTTYYRLTAIIGNVSRDEALALLFRLTESTAMKQSAHDAAIQILTPIEADGLQFTHCWMTGVSEKQWPPQAMPSPFIPYALQKSKGIPQADINLQTQQARAFLTGLADRCTQHIVFSFPLQDGDIPVKPAAMLLEMDGELSGEFENELKSNLDASLHSLATTQESNKQLDILKDEVIVPLKEGETASGGSLLLADQADCPFRNFANKRLDANRLEKLVPGLSARDAGTLVHLVLEMFWKHMQSQSNLFATQPKDLETKLADIINAAVIETAARHKFTMTEKYCALEKRRLHDLLLQWLEEERLRGSFTVLDSECETTWQFQNLTLKLRIDRIDKTAEDKLVLVDYKTSRSTSVDWEDARPVNSQLMLYSLSVAQEQRHPEPVVATFFAQVNIENTEFRGLAQDKGVYPGVSVEELRGKWNGLSDEASWESLINHWEASLGALVTEFLSGYVAIAPLKAGSCTYCQIRPVCRIDEVIEPVKAGGPGS